MIPNTRKVVVKKALIPIMTSEFDDHGMRIYLREIGQTPLLTPEQEIELAKRIKKGDAKARDLMIRANLRLVVKIARDYAQLGLPLLDLISEGNIGLMKAVDRFDPKKGTKLSTYAAWWIKQAIKRALANQSKTIRLPAHLVDKIARMRKVQERIAQETGREPSVEELAEALGVKPRTVEMWMALTVKPASLDAPLGDEESEDLGSIVGDTRVRTAFEELRDEQMRKQVERLIDRLPRREREIILLRFGLRGRKPETLEKVGKRFKITRERVRQLQNIAIRKLRKMLEEEESPGAPKGKGKR